MVPIFDLELDDTPFMRPILIYAENFKKKIMEYEVLRTTLEDKRPDEILTLEDVKKGAASLEELVAQLTVEEMADLCVGTERLEEGGNVIGSSSACGAGSSRGYDVGTDREAEDPESDPCRWTGRITVTDTF